MLTLTEDERRLLQTLERCIRRLGGEQRLTEVIDFLERLMREADYRAHSQTTRQQLWRRWKLRVAVLGMTVGIIASTVNAVQSFH